MIRLNYIKITQKGISFFLTAIDAKKIVDRINVNRRKIDDSNIKYDLLNLDETSNELDDLKIGKGLQRELIKNKVDEISEYLSGDLGLIPNSIILNISDPLSLVAFEEQLNIPEDESILITALDGQHRVEGVKNYVKTHPTEIYEIPLTIFYNTELEFQAYLFSTINSKQTKINKSFLYDLLSLNKNQIDEFKLSHEIAYWLNSSNNSVLKGSFKLLGKGEGWLSQAAFIDYLMPNVFISKKNNANVIFKKYIKEKRYNYIADFINDYFKTFINTFEPDFNSKEYIFRTSFVFGLFMRIMPYIFIYSLNLLTFQYDIDLIQEIFNWIKQANIDFKKGGVNSGIGSSGRQRVLVNNILEIIQSHTDLANKVNAFQDSNR